MYLSKQVMVGEHDIVLSYTRHNLTLWEQFKLKYV